MLPRLHTLERSGATVAAAGAISSTNHVASSTSALFLEDELPGDDDRLAGRAGARGGPRAGLVPVDVSAPEARTTQEEQQEDAAEDGDIRQGRRRRGIRSRVRRGRIVI